MKLRIDRRGLRDLTSLSTRALALACLSLPTLLTSSAAAQTEFFGEWDGPNSVQLYVALPPLGAAGNPGTRQFPLPSITSAVNAATTGGQVGTVPVTINVIDPGLGSAFTRGSGESFPITLPAHGVTVEAYGSNNTNGPVLSAGFRGASEVFLFDTLGNTSLPASTLRGLEIHNSNRTANSAAVRIAVPGTLADEFERVKPEIRDCLLTGTSQFGIQMVASANRLLEPVIERNHITATTTFSGIAGVDVVGDGDAPFALASPLIRCNQIDLFPTNLRVSGGGLATQPRIFSNFIQAGEVNVDLIDCAPFVNCNTIAFATSNTLTTAFGVRWVGVPEMSMSSNIIWNPDIAGVAADDVNGNLGVFGVNPSRAAFFNMDEDNTFLDATVALTPGIVTTYDVALMGPPQFVGATPVGAAAVDLHLQATSPCLFGGWRFEAAIGAPAVFSSTLAGPAGPIPIRLDVAYDIDFEGRVQGQRVSISELEIGADEFTGVFATAAAGRAASLRATSNPSIGVPLDVFGNLVPDATNNWNTQVEVLGIAGDLVLFMAGAGFDVQVTDPNTATLVENRSVYQHTVLDSTFLPSILTNSSLNVALGPNSNNWVTAVIPTSGVLVANVTLGSVNAATLEAELQIQAIVVDPTLTEAQTTNRLTIELNE